MLLQRLKMKIKVENLLLGLWFLNALVISSLRLDNNTEPEVGASTYSFAATPSTRIYISKKNIEKANASVDKEQVYFNQQNYNSKLGQLKSYLTCPNICNEKCT
ncbi:hypothetical protein MFLAVUS_009418 [Mucor flavus]|uniref:Uncharacterized protein n=1 Tax=Mucor flavus TaxID=439312 RepID=A0ABP9Z9V2_9FUNG